MISELDTQVAQINSQLPRLPHPQQQILHSSFTLRDNDKLRSQFTPQQHRYQQCPPTTEHVSQTPKLTQIENQIRNLDLRKELFLRKAALSRKEPTFQLKQKRDTLMRRQSQYLQSLSAEKPKVFQREWMPVEIMKPISKGKRYEDAGKLLQVSLRD